MQKIHARKIIGLYGVAKNETSRAQKCGKCFEHIMACIALWLPLQWYLQHHIEIGKNIALVCNWIVWSIFLLETIVVTYLVARKKRYLSENWMNILIIILSFPPVWMSTPLIAVIRGIRLLVLFRLLLPFWDSVTNLLSKNRFSYTLIAACIMTTFWGIIIAAIEPNIKSPWDGIWFAWETITTIGFGDIIPVTPSGRLLAILLMVSGVGFISLLTANFSAYIISKGNKTLKKEEDEILAILKGMQKQLNEIQKRMGKLEKKQLVD